MDEGVAIGDVSVDEVKLLVNTGISDVIIIIPICDPYDALVLREIRK